MLIITADQGMWSLIIGVTSLILCLQKEIANKLLANSGHQTKPCFFLSREKFIFFLNLERQITPKQTHIERLVVHPHGRTHSLHLAEIK